MTKNEQFTLTKKIINISSNQLQGDPNQNCPFLRPITQKLSTSDPMLVKPKCVLEAVYF